MTFANKEYKTILVESRNGINLSEEGLKYMDSIVSPLILQGQTPYQIIKNHPEIKCTEKTIYNYITSGALSVKNLDLPRKVKYKPRKSNPSEINNKGIFEGRTYKDFLDYLQTYPDTNVVEMDTVIGCEGSKKVLFTMFFRSCKLMLIYLLPDKSPASVKKVFDHLEKKMSTFIFCRTFPVILTDRGVEFSMLLSIEKSQKCRRKFPTYFLIIIWGTLHLTKTFPMIFYYLNDNTIIGLFLFIFMLLLPI